MFWQRDHRGASARESSARFRAYWKVTKIKYSRLPIVKIKTCLIGRYIPCIITDER